MQDNTDQARKLIIDFLNQKHESTVRFEKKTILRIEKNGMQAILAWEIYHDKANPNENTTIRILNDLVKEGKVESFFYNNYLWYAQKPGSEIYGHDN